MLALPLAAILVLHASAFEVAALTTVEWAPWLLFSLPAGAWVDRLARRRVLIVADLGRAAALLSVPVGYSLDALTIGQLYAVAFVAGTLTVFFDLAYVAYLPSLVERRRLGEGNAKLETTRSAGQLAGPGLAGLLVQAFSAPVALLADAISFVASALFLGAIRRREEPRPRGERQHLAAEVKEGIGFALRHPLMRPSVAFLASSNFFYSVMFGIFLVYAVRSLGFTAGEVGLVFTLANISVVAGALLATRLGRLLGTGPAIVLSAFMLGWPLLFVPLVPSSVAFPVFVGVFALTGFFGVTINVLAVSLAQAITPDRLQGRAAASRRLLVLGSVPLGSLAGGALAATIGLRETLWVGAAGGTLAFLPVLLSPVRGVREIPEEPPIEVPAATAR